MHAELMTTLSAKRGKGPFVNRQFSGSSRLSVVSSTIFPTWYSVFHLHTLFIPRMLPRRLGRPGDATRLKYAFLSSVGRATAPTVTATTVNAFMKNNWFAAAGDALCHEVSKDHALVSKLPGVADLRPGGWILAPSNLRSLTLGCGSPPLAHTSALSPWHSHQSCRYAFCDQLSWLMVPACGRGLMSTLWDARQWCRLRPFTQTIRLGQQQSRKEPTSCHHRCIMPLMRSSVTSSMKTV